MFLRAALRFWWPSDAAEPAPIALKVAVPPSFGASALVTHTRVDDTHGSAFAVWESGALLAMAGNNLFKHAPALGRELARAALGEPLRDELRPESRLGG